MSNLFYRIDCKEIFKKLILFVFAFTLMMFYLSNREMINRSGDATSIWKTIKSYYSGNIVGSYVLYKGFASVYPYVWLYKLSVIFSVDEFLFVKIYHGLLFSYVATIGFPYFVSKMLKIEIKFMKNIALICVLFWVWRYTSALGYVMVDLPTLAYFLIALSITLKINSQENSPGIITFSLLGLMVGLVYNISGQYILACFAIILHVVLIKLKGISKNVSKGVAFKSVLSIVILLFSFSLVSVVNHEFDKKIVDPLRAEGEWIPSKEVWLRVGLFNFEFKQMFPSIPDNLGIAIRNFEYGEDFNINLIGYSAEKGYDSAAIYKEYLRLVLKYPFEFMSRYFSRFFIAISPDNNNLNLPMLFLNFTAIFYVLLKIRAIKKVNQIVNPSTLLWLSFLLALVPPVILHIESRYAIQIQGLIFSLFILDNDFWKRIKDIPGKTRSFLDKKSPGYLLMADFNSVYIYYIIFMVSCFTFIGSLHELVGPIPSQLFFGW